LLHAGVLFGSLASDYAADSEFGDKLESPTSESEVVSVPTVGEAVVEDRFDGVRCLIDGPVS
jgi:hypothetical protein